MAGPVVKQAEFTRETLRTQYLELVARNPLLGRVEGTCRTLHWTDEETRTAQLIVCVASNASLQARLVELERALGQPVG